MTLERGEFKLTLKDAVQYIAYIATLVMFFSSQSSKLDELQRRQEEMAADSKESRNDSKVTVQNMQNQINANSLQINLLQKDMQMLKDYYGKKMSN